MSNFGKVALGTVIIASFTIPVFRSGGRTGLTFWGWVINHTIFGPPIEYIPLEDYSRELEVVEPAKQLPSTSQATETSWWPIAMGVGALGIGTLIATNKGKR